MTDLEHRILRALENGPLHRPAIESAVGRTETEVQPTLGRLAKAATVTVSGNASVWRLTAEGRKALRDETREAAEEDYQGRMSHHERDRTSARGAKTTGASGHQSPKDWPINSADLARRLGYSDSDYMYFHWATNQVVRPELRRLGCPKTGDSQQATYLVDEQTAHEVARRLGRALG